MLPKIKYENKCKYFHLAKEKPLNLPFFFTYLAKYSHIFLCYECLNFSSTASPNSFGLSVDGNFKFYAKDGLISLGLMFSKKGVKSLSSL